MKLAICTKDTPRAHTHSSPATKACALLALALALTTYAARGYHFADVIEKVASVSRAEFFHDLTNL